MWAVCPINLRYYVVNLIDVVILNKTSFLLRKKKDQQANMTTD
jgi:hypothetical protein